LAQCSDRPSIVTSVIGSSPVESSTSKPRPFTQAE
jgi:hypothetical protein